jgi:hypothetical protein
LVADSARSYIDLGLAAILQMSNKAANPIKQIVELCADWLHITALDFLAWLRATATSTIFNIASDAVRILIFIMIYIIKGTRK